MQSSLTGHHVDGTEAPKNYVAVHEDMYAAIDGLIDKLDRQVLRHKEKLTNHRPGNGENWKTVESGEI